MEGKGKSKNKKRQQTGSSNTSDHEGLFSPVSVTPDRCFVQGNLTGTPRVIKDTCADWHNYTQKWETLNNNGFQIITQIANSKLNVLFGEESQAEVRSEVPEDGNSGASAMPEEMKGLCSQLEGILQSMKNIVKKMERMTEALNGVCKLEQYQSKGEPQDPHFRTWPTRQFYDSSKQLLEMYRKEVKLKVALVENVAHVKDRNRMMFFTSSWLHQPYIEDCAQLIVESMVIETGLR